MDCVNHPGAPASDVCSRCNEAICESCKREHRGQLLCVNCVQQAEVGAGTANSPHLIGFYSRDSAPPRSSRDDSEPIPPAPSPASSSFDQPVHERRKRRRRFLGIPVGRKEPERETGGLAGSLHSLEAELTRRDRGGSVRTWRETPAFFGAFLAGALGACIAVFLWYQMTILVNTKLPLHTLIVGLLVGVGCRFGAGRPSPIVGIMACLISAGALVGGGYVVFLQENNLSNDPVRILGYHLGFPYDCEFDKAETEKVVRFWIDKEEWRAMDKDERQRARFRAPRVCKSQVQKWQKEPETFFEASGLTYEPWNTFVKEAFWKHSNWTGFLFLCTLLPAFWVAVFEGGWGPAR